MSDCGGTDYSRGATLLEARISDAKISDSIISNSEFTAGAITNLASIDDISVEKIAAALSQLPPESLARLAKAIVAAISITPAAQPDTTTQPELPTTIAGGRELLLGKPASWIELSNGVVPVYTNVCSS